MAQQLQSADDFPSSSHFPQETHSDSLPAHHRQISDKEAEEDEQYSGVAVAESSSMGGAPQTDVLAVDDSDDRSPACTQNPREQKGGEETKKNEEETKKTTDTSVGSSNPATGRNVSLSKLNAQAPEFIPRGPISPLQAPATPSIPATPGLPTHSLQQQQPGLHRSQGLPRLMVPQTPRAAYSAPPGGSPRMSLQFPGASPQMAQASFGLSRPHAHGSPHHSPAINLGAGGGGAEYYGSVNDHDMVQMMVTDADAMCGGASTSSSKGVLTEDLRQKIVRQVEYYFSDANLTTNDYLMKFVSKDPEGFVPIPLIASFKKVRSLVSNHALVTAALRTSSQLVVSEDGKKVRRAYPLSDVDIEELQSRMVVAENLPEDHSNQNLERVFGAVGNVKMVRICPPQANGASPVGPRFPKTDVLVSNKLHALVEYETVEQAEKAVAELNDERNWRSGLRVRLLIRRTGKTVHQPRGRKAGTDGFDGNGEEEDVSTSEVGNDKHVDDLLQQSERHAEFMGDDHHPNDREGGGRRGRSRGRGRARGRGQQHNGRGHPVGTPPQCSNSTANEASGKQPPGPRMPDGTRGFTMGRGRPPTDGTV